ncbi:MAG: molybdopterin-guanine dinucleotide biosynthesis protein MobB, partial [bacterium]
LRTGVIKHDAHGLDIDREGKDTDRFFKAGADVLIRSPAGAFLRTHHRDDVPLEHVMREFGPQVDLVLVEGHKTTPLAHKLWISGPEGDQPPPEATNIQRVLKRGEDRAQLAMEIIEPALQRLWRSSPVYAGVLIGGGSTRMGRPKHLITENGETWLHTSVAAVQQQVDKVVILGSGEIPADLRSLTVLPDVEDAGGPLRGMLAAMRWAPMASWIFVPCDTPGLTAEAMRWILTNRKPGVWAVQPRQMESGILEPLPGWYDFRSRHLLERCRGPADLAGHEKVATPPLPREFAGAWTNLNTPSELNTARRTRTIKT